MKRHEAHKLHYLFYTIRPAFVCDVLNYLILAPFYVKNNTVYYDPAFFDRYDKLYDTQLTQVDFIIDEADVECFSENKVEDRKPGT